MPINKLSITNFKAFGPVPQSVPFKPITLVFGPNSAGKSSLLHSLLWLREGLLRGDIDVQEPLRAEGINLGGFDQIVHRHAPSVMPVIGWTISASAIEPGVGGWNQMSDFSIDLGFQHVNGKAGPALLSIGNQAGEFLRANRKEDETWQITVLDWDHPAVAAIISAVGGFSGDLPESIKQVFPADLFELIMPGLIPERIKPRGGANQLLFVDTLPSAFRGLFDAFRESLSSTLQSFVYVPPLRTLPERGFDPLRAGTVWQRLAKDHEIRRHLNDWLGDKKRFKSPCRLEVIQYLREDIVRQEMPSVIRDCVIHWLGKTSETGDVEEVVHAARERWRVADNRADYAKQCPQFWERLVSNELDYFSNNHLGQGIDDWESLSEEEQRAHAEQQAEDCFGGDPHYGGDDTEPFLKFLEQDPEMQEFVSSYLDESLAAADILHPASDSGLKSRAAMLLRDLTTETLTSFQDVGVGISQVIPVVANAISLRNSFIAIEQPEIHIHPALQAELGDVFIESALGANKNTFLLETHSEHLILRILRRIRETTRDKLPEGMARITPDDVAVLYVEPGNDGATVRELRIDSQGRFLDDWPNGFFEDRLDELI